MTSVRLDAAKTVTACSAAGASGLVSPHAVSTMATASIASERSADFIDNPLEGVGLHNRPCRRAFLQTEVGERFGRYT